MKRQPTELVALSVYGLAVIVSALIWLRARKLYEGDLIEFGSALPAPTQILFDFHLPAVLCLALVASFTAGLFLRGLAMLIVSTVSVTIAVLGLGAIWWALRLPFLPL